MPALCDDGYEINGYIQADESGVYEAIRFRFRPSTSEENQALQCRYAVAGNDAKETNRATVDFLKAHLVSWDLHWTAKDRKRRPADIDDRSLSKLAGLLRLRLLGIVQGAARSDRLPDGTDPNVDVEAERGN